MTWVKLDDLLPEHAKIADLSADAFRSWIFVLCLCSRLLTDGEVSEGQLASARVSKRARRELVESGLWHDREGGGIVVHDYLKYQPSKAHVEARRKATRERMTRHRADSNTVSDAVTDSAVTPSVTGLPIPARSPPVPDPDLTHTADPRPVRLTARWGPGESQPQQELISCPRDLKLSEDQRATLEVNMIPAQAIDALTRRFVLKSLANTGDRRTLDAWRKCAAMAVSGGWNNPKLRAEAMSDPAPGVLEHEARQRAPEPKAPRLPRRPEPPLPSMAERSELAEKALAKLGGES